MKFHLKIIYQKFLVNIWPSLFTTPKPLEGLAIDIIPCEDFN